MPEEPIAPPAVTAEAALVEQDVMTEPPVEVVATEIERAELADATAGKGLFAQILPIGTRSDGRIAQKVIKGLTVQLIARQQGPLVRISAPIAAASHCKQLMPHLSDMAGKLRRIEKSAVIDIPVDEQGEPAEMQAKLIEMGERVVELIDGMTFGKARVAA